MFTNFTVANIVATMQPFGVVVGVVALVAIGYRLALKLISWLVARFNA